MKDLLGLELKDIPAKIESEVMGLEEILLKYNSFDMIGNFIVIELFHNVDSPSTYAGKSFIVEYLSLIYLKHPFCSGENRLIDKKITEEISSRIYNIFSSANLLLIGQENSTSLTEKCSGNFRFKQILEELFVRGPAYPHHAQAFYHKLYEPFNEWFTENLGFTIDTVISVSDAASSLMNEKMDAFRVSVQDTLFRFWGDVKKLRCKKSLSGEFPQEPISYFAKMPGQRAYKASKNYIYASAFAKIGTDVLSLSVEEISSQTGEQCNKIASCLNFFSLEFMDVPSDFSMPEPVHLLKSRPIIHHKERYMFPNPSLLFWAAHRRLEECITPELDTCISNSGHIWRRYEKNRRTQVEKESIQLITEALDTEEHFENVFYKFVIDGREKRCELDGMILFDNRIFLIEAKAGTLSSAARRGGDKRIARDVKKLITDPHQQVTRAKKYIESYEGGDVPFSLSDGSGFTVSKDRVEEIFMVTVTLENLDVYTAMLHETVQPGEFADGELPWAVSLFDLKVISDLTDFPSQFVHYIRKRLLLNKKPNIYSHDELDWFGLYLQHGLYFDERADTEEYSHMYYDMFSSIFDDWYYFEMGIKKSQTQRPRLPLSDFIKQLFRELSEGKEYKHSEVISMILDMSGSARDQLEKMILAASNKTKCDGKSHDFFLTSKNGDFGISFYSFPHLGEDEKQLADYHITLRKYATKAKKWLGIVHTPGNRGIIHGWLFLDELWVFDEKLEELKMNLKYTEIPIHQVN